MSRLIMEWSVIVVVIGVVVGLAYYWDEVLDFFR